MPTKTGRKFEGPVTCCVTGTYTELKKARARARRKARLRRQKRLNEQYWRNQYSQMFPERTQRRW